METPSNLAICLATVSGRLQSWLLAWIHTEIWLPIKHCHLDTNVSKIKLLIPTGPMLHKVLLFQASPCLWMSTLFFAYFGKSTWTPLYLSFSLTPHTEYIGTSRCSSFKPIYLTISSAPWSTSPSACMWDALLAEFLIPQSVPHWSQRDSHTMHITPRYSSAQTLCSLCHSHIYRFLRLLLLSLAPPHPALASRPHYKAHSHLRTPF